MAEDPTDQAPRQLHPLPRGLVELYGLLAVLFVLVPEWMAGGALFGFRDGRQGTDQLNSTDALKFNFNGTIRELLIETIEKRFHQYSILVKYFELEDFSYGEFNIYEKLISQGRIETMLDLVYSDEKEEDETFKLLYRQPLRRN